MVAKSVRNNNPGNIRDVGIAWEGRVGSEGGFVKFDTPAMGVRAMTKNLYTYQNRGLTTVNQMITRWAPPSDNNPTNSYIDYVANQMGVDPNQSINLESNPSLTQSMINSMIQFEGGSEASSYFNSHIASGIAMANGVIDPDSTPIVLPDDVGDLADIINPTLSEDSAVPGGEPIAGARGKSQFYEDNILNGFDNYTYSWKIHMVHPQEADKPPAQTISANRVKTLAESGVEAEINIEEVEQNLILAFSKSDRSSVANEFNIRLAEPGGVTLFNRILFAARQLGIESHLKATYFLELNFKGYTDDGTAVSNIIGPYFYACTLTDLQLQHQDGASMYTANFIETKSDAYTRVNLHLLQDTIFQAKTFGEFLSEFQTKINQQEINRMELTDLQLLPNVYTFALDGAISDWGQWKFGAIEGIDNEDGTKGISISGLGTLQFSFAKGTSIVAAIATALYQTTNFQSFPIFGGGFGKDKPNDPKLRPDSIAKLTSWMKYETEVKYGPYDPLKKHYQKLITYTVGQYVTPEIAHDPVSYSEVYTGTRLQKQRLSNIVKNGLLRKKFDYTHTGLNTEVLGFDLTLNNTYYQLQALNHGISGRADDSIPGFSQLDEELQDILGRKSEFDKRLLELDAQITDLQNKIDQENEFKGPGAGFSQQLVDRFEAEKQQLELQRSAIKLQAEANRQAKTDYMLKYVEQAGDLRLPGLAKRYITQNEVSSRARAAAAHAQGYDMPLDFVPNIVNSKAVQGPDKAKNAGSLMLGAVEVNLNSLADLANIMITVRGDPYWLGQPKGQSGGAPYTRGGNNFFLNINFPTYPDDSTGLMNIVERDFGITGLYRVTQVQARYADGQFIMMLDAFRDTNTNVGLVLEELTSGEISLGNFRQLADVYTSPEQGDGPGGGNVTPSSTGPGNINFVNGTGTGTVTQSQSGIRNQPITSSLESILQRAGANAGVNVVVTSGGQPSSGPNRTGSTRHDNGRAADVQLFVPGRNTPLSLNNAADVPIIQNFINQSRLAGATGLGAGNGYMGDNTFHIDNAQPGSVQYWGGQLDNGTFRARNAPSWLRDIARGLV